MSDVYEDGHLKIKSWAEEDRPREKMLLKGWAALSDAELIAILLGTGSGKMTAVDLGKSLLAGAGNDLNRLAKSGIKEMMKIKGIGEAKAITVGAALELGRRRKELEPKQEVSITSSEAAYLAMKRYLHDLPVEQFWIMLLSRSNSIIKACHVSTGTVSGTVADPRVIFKLAIEELASGIILFHNHPSGNKKPSNEDVKLTKDLKAGGDLLHVPILDHIIYTNHGYYSFRDEGNVL